MALLQEQGLSPVSFCLPKLANSHNAVDSRSQNHPSVLENHQSQEQSLEKEHQGENQSLFSHNASAKEIIAQGCQSEKQSQEITASDNSQNHQNTSDSSTNHQNVSNNLQSASDNSQNATNSPSPVSGNAFFICDGKPVNNFEFYRPWFEGLGYTYPLFNIPLWMIMTLAKLQEFIYFWVYKFFPFSPFVTPTEANKGGVTHYFSYRKAQTSFGYSPTRPNDQTYHVKYMKEKGFSNTNKWPDWSILFITSSVKLAVAAFTLSIFLYILV